MFSGNVFRAGVLAAGVWMVAFAAGCSDSAIGKAVAPAESDGSADARAPDAGPADGAAPETDGGARASATGGIVIDLVHAAPDLPAVGLCLAAVVSGGPLFVAPFDGVQGPLPRYAATQLTIPAALEGAISGMPVRVYLVPGYAPAAGAAPSCAAVLQSGSPVVLLREFAAGTFQPGRGYIVAVTGCTSPATSTVRTCGPDLVNPSRARPLGAWAKEFERGATDPGVFGAQVVHLSPQLQGTSFPVPTGDGGYASVPIFAHGLKLAFGKPTAEAGAFAFVAWASGGAPVKFAEAPTARATLPAPGNPNTLALGVFTAAADSPVPPPVAPVSTVPMPYVAAATLGPTNPGVVSYFAEGVTYTFFLVGDPAQSSSPTAPNFGPDFLRILALPNHARPERTAADGGGASTDASPARDASTPSDGSSSSDAASAIADGGPP